MKALCHLVVAGIAICLVTIGTADENPSAQTPVVDIYGKTIVLPKESGAKDASRYLGEEIPYKKFAFDVMHGEYVRVIKEELANVRKIVVPPHRMIEKRKQVASSITTGSVIALRDKITTSVLVGQLWHKERKGLEPTPENLKAFSETHKGNPLFSDLMPGEIVMAVEQFGKSEMTVEDALVRFPSSPEAFEDQAALHLENTLRGETLKDSLTKNTVGTSEKQNNHARL